MGLAKLAWLKFLKMLPASALSGSDTIATRGTSNTFVGTQNVTGSITATGNIAVVSDANAFLLGTAFDVGLVRNAAGVVKVTDGGSGTGKILADGSLLTNLPASGGETIVMRTADTAARTDSTYADDDATGGTLTFAVLANKNYVMRYVLYITTGTTANSKIQWTGPSSPTSVFYTGYGQGSSGLSVTTATAFSSTQSYVGVGATRVIMGELVLLNAANAGNVTLQWAQTTTTGGEPTVLKAGSYFKYRQTN